MGGRHRVANLAGPIGGPPLSSPQAARRAWLSLSFHQIATSTATTRPAWRSDGRTHAVPRRRALRPLGLPPSLHYCLSLSLSLSTPAGGGAHRPPPPPPPKARPMHACMLGSRPRTPTRQERPRPHARSGARALFPPHKRLLPRSTPPCAAARTEPQPGPLVARRWALDGRRAPACLSHHGLANDLSFAVRAGHGWRRWEIIEWDGTAGAQRQDGRAQRQPSVRTRACLVILSACPVAAMP